MNSIILYIAKVLIAYAIVIALSNTPSAFHNRRAKKKTSAEPQPHPDHFDVVELAKLAATIYDPNKGNYAAAIEQAASLQRAAYIFLNDKIMFEVHKANEDWLRATAAVAGTEK